MEYLTVNWQGISLHAGYLAVGRDLLVVVSGGDQPHLGAVSMVGTAGSVQESHSCYFAHHREQELTRPMAEALAARLERQVVVVAGMHWRQFDRQKLEQVQQAWQQLTQALLQALS